MAQSGKHGGSPKEIDPAFDHPAERFRFSGGTLNEFKSILEVPDAQFEREVLPELELAATSFRRWIAQTSTSPKRAETNREMKALAADAKAFAMRLRGIDDDVLFETILRFEPQSDAEAQQTPQGSRRVRLATELDDLARAMTKAHRASASRRGPEKNHDLGHAIGVLVQIFESATGKRVTHTPAENGIYDGEPRSEAGRFLRTFFNEADPRKGASRVSDSAISSALSASIRLRNRKRRIRRVSTSKSD